MTFGMTHLQMRIGFFIGSEFIAVNVPSQDFKARYRKWNVDYIVQSILIHVLNYI